MKEPRFKRRWKPELPSLKGANLIGVDIETCDPLIKEYGAGVRRNGYTVGISVAANIEGEDKSWYIPFRHEEGPNIEPEKVIEWAKEELGREDQEKVFANGLYDLDYLTQEGIQVRGRFNDVQIAEPLINENQRRFALEIIANKYLKTGKFESELNSYCHDVFGPKVNPKSVIWKMPSNIVRKYAEVDALEPLKIFRLQKKILEEEDLMGIYNLETDLVPVLLKMKRDGIRVDVERAKTLDKEYARHIAENRDKLNQMAGYDVNFNAAASIAIYCDQNGIEYPLTKKTQKPSFTKGWMEDREEEFFELILSLKQDYKLSGSFVEGVVLNYAINGRIHCQLNQLKSDDYGTVSGRFSSSLPNLQQLPSPEKALGPMIRSLFLPEEGEQWVCCDYSQIEPRLTLHYAKGKEAEEAREFFKENPEEDAYGPMLNAIYDSIKGLIPKHSIDVQGKKFLKENSKTKLSTEQIREIVRRNLTRKQLKIIYLGLCYGQGKPGLIKKLGVSYKEGNEIINTFHKLVPYIRALAKHTKEVAESRGYVRTILGRRRRFNTYEPRGNFGEGRLPDLPYDEAVLEYGHNITRAYTYKALNSIIQGGSADQIKKAMVEISKSGVLDNCRMLLTVHDELNFSVPKTKIGEECKKEIKHTMETCIPLKLPTPVDMEVGENWGYIK